MLAGCEHYAIDLEKPNTAVRGEQFPAFINRADLYTMVYADAIANKATALDVCRVSVADRVMMKPQKAISIGLGMPNTDVTVPIYTVTSGEKCSIAYNQRYIFSPQTLTSIARYNITAKYSYEVKNEEQFTKYMSSSLTLAGKLAPQGAPVIGTAQALLGSALFSDVSSAFTQAFNQSIDFKEGIYSFNIADDPLPMKEIRYPIVAKLLKSDFTLNQEKPPVAVGEIKLTVERAPTLLGQYSGGKLDFSGLSYMTKIVTLAKGADGSLNPVDEYVYHLANKLPDTAVEQLQGMTNAATVAQVRKACSILRGKLQEIGLNNIDTAAYLWRVYTESDFGQTFADMRDGTSDKCLLDNEKAVILGAGIAHWAPNSRNN